MQHKVDPRMHSAEHMLNQAMVRKFSCNRCFSAHIGKKKSKCDYLFHHPFTENHAREIESIVNREIKKDHTVSEAYLNRSEANDLYDLGRLPDTVNQKVRIIKIGNFDACPCIGEHVDKTSEIGRFRITTTSSDNGKLRIRFKLSKS